MKSSMIAGVPQMATLAKFETKLASSEKTGFAAKVNQLGINMVDLMMWLVIAALLLAAALQGIGFYQKAAWNYQLKSDADAVRTYMETQYTLSSPNAYTAFTTTPAELKMTTSNGVTNTVTTQTTSAGGWTAIVCSGALKKAGTALPALSIESADSTKATAVACPVAGP